MKTLICIFALLYSVNLFSQTYDVPKNYILEQKEDYAPYEQDIIKTVNWLIETPVNQEAEKRAEASAFLLRWLIGSPDTHVEIDSRIVNFVGSTSPLLIVFMGGWAKYSLENKGQENKIDGNLNGLNAVITFYNKNKKLIPKEPAVEKYIKLQKKDKLRAYIEEAVSEK